MTANRRTNPRVQADAARIGAEIARAQGGTDPFAAAVRATRMPMVVTDPRQPDNPVVFANDAFCRLTGYSRAEIVGRNCRFLQGPGSDPDAIARIRDAVAAQQPLEVDIRNHRKDGEPFWNRLIMAPVHDAAGELAYFVASQVDVTLERERVAGLEGQNAALVTELAGRLREQEDSAARLRLAAAAGRLGMWEMDLRTRELQASPLCRQGFGQDPLAPLTCAQLRAATHPADRARLRAVLHGAIRGGAEFDVEYRILLPGGAVRWVQVRAEVERGPGGPVRMAGVSLDVTERREAALRLELSEQALRLATDAAEVGTWDMDLRTGALAWPDRTKAMFGISPGQPCSMEDFYACLHPEDRDATSAALASALDPAVRATYDVEYRTIGKEDGVVRWVAARGRGLFEDGVCHRALGTAIDITARKEAGRRQAFLLGLLDELRQLTDPAAVMSAAAAALGRHLGASRVGYALVQDDGETALLHTGYAHGVAPLGGAVPLDRFGPSAVARLREGLVAASADTGADPALDGAAWAAIEAGSFVSVPLLREGRLRATLWVNRRNPCAWPPGEVALIQDVAARTWDAVERARAEAALRDANAALESRIAAALAEQERIGEALRQSQKMEAVGQLTGGIAHDFNNLLTGILGSLDMMARRAAEGRTADVGRYAAAATASAQRAAALTQRLLAFARRQPLDPKRVDANRLLSGMEDLLRRTLGPGVHLQFRLDSAVWPTLCDPNQLENAVLNLAINARDAMAGSTGEAGRLTVETSNAALGPADGADVQPGGYVCVTVSDTGAGMTPDVLARAFEPFFTTKPIGQGTGLGLSMVYGFVKQSGGHARIQSEPGAGTAFRLYLPRHHEAPAIPIPAVPLAPRADGEVVLVVEDEPAVRALVVETLAGQGCTVLEASDGPGGLRILQSGVPVDLLVTDVGLPGLNGRQLADAARALRPGLPVLYMTGYAHNAAVGHGPALEPGTEIIPKPFTLDALARKVRAMVG